MRKAASAPGCARSCRPSGALRQVRTKVARSWRPAQTRKHAFIGPGAFWKAAGGWGRGRTGAGRDALRARSRRQRQSIRFAWHGLARNFVSDSRC